MQTRFLTFIGALAVAAVPIISAPQQDTPVVEKRTAPEHPMHYFVSQPQGWTPNRVWPVLVVITDADRQFESTAGVFANARGSRPFVIVTPLVLSGGGTAQQHMTDFDYDRATWDLAAKDGNCKFDEDGLTAVLADVRRRFHTDARVFITGWEAGGHVVLSQALNNPERYRGAVAVTPNFQQRCVAEPPAAHNATATRLPIRNLVGTLDQLAQGPIGGQWRAFESLARARGFTDLSLISVPGRGHGALAADVFEALTPMLASGAGLGNGRSGY